MPTNAPSSSTRTEPTRAFDMAVTAWIIIVDGSTVTRSVLMTSRTVVIESLRVASSSHARTHDLVQPEGFHAPTEPAICPVSLGPGDPARLPLAGLQRRDG